MNRITLLICIFLAAMAAAMPAYSMPLELAPGDPLAAAPETSTVDAALLTLQRNDGNVSGYSSDDRGAGEKTAQWLQDARMDADVRCPVLPATADVLDVRQTYCAGIALYRLGGGVPISIRDNPREPRTWAITRQCLPHPRPLSRWERRT